MRFACCCFDAVKYSSKTIGSVIKQMTMAMVCMVQALKVVLVGVCC